MRIKNGSSMGDIQKVLLQIMSATKEDKTTRPKKRFAELNKLNSFKKWFIKLI